MTAEANAATDAASAGGQTGLSQDSATSYQRDKIADSTYGQDVGADERYEAMSADAADAWRTNVKRTYDLHQTLDTDAILQQRKQQAKLDSVELAEREQRIRHTDAEFNLRLSSAKADETQRLRHADRMDAISNTVIANQLVDLKEDMAAIRAAVCK